jgi:outer membrane protein assembly factor BamC
MSIRKSPPAVMLWSAVGAIVATLAGCTWTGSVFTDKVDYQAARTRTAPLEVPPDLSQLPRDERFTVPERPQTVTASSAAPGRPGAAVAGATATSTGGTVAPTGAIARIAREGNHRWLVVNMAPEKAWPILLDFWPSVGLAVERSDAASGVMETVWAENRAKLDQGIIRQTLGRFLGSVYSTGEQDRFRARLERTPAGTSEIFISHRGMTEVFTSTAQDRTAWQPRPADPELEAEMLQRLLVRFEKPTTATTTAATTAGRPPLAAATASGAAAAVSPERAFIVKNASGQSERLDIDDPFDRAWRRIGLALDRGGFTVEDRDRAKGVYFVRYLDPDYEAKAKDAQGFFSKMLGKEQAVPPPQYRVQLTSAGDAGTQVRVLSSEGKPELSPAGDRILALLKDQLR